MLNSLARTASLEATPRQILGFPFDDHVLHRGTLVYVPCLPGADFAETLEACRRLIEAGMHPVPHLTARAVVSRAQLSDSLAEFAAMGGQHLLLIAGDTDSPRGRFTNTLDILDSGVLLDNGFRSVGVAGHPGKHPKASPRELRHALEIKRDYAVQTGTSMWIVTQFVFDARVFLDWLRRHEDVIDPLPVYFGMAGPTNLATLMFYAAQCGVSTSARMFRHRPDTVKLLNAWTPDALIRAAAEYCTATPESRLRGVHLFPFGGLKRSLDWLDSLRLDRDSAEVVVAET